MYNIKDIYDLVDKFAPFRLSESWDNCGLIIGDYNSEVSSCVVALDITPQVLKSAIDLNTNLIITHHPVIFNPIKNIREKSIVYQLISNNIAVISAHTNLDKAKYGLSEVLAKKIGLKEIKNVNPTVENYYKINVFVPKENVELVSKSMTEAGAGIIGNYSGCSFRNEGIGTFFPNQDSNPYMGEKLKLGLVSEIKLEMICPKHNLRSVIDQMVKAHPYETPAYDIFENLGLSDEYSFLKVGKLNKPTSPESFAKELKARLGTKFIKFCDSTKDIKTVAVVSGGGCSMLDAIIKHGIDAFVTGDIKHDKFIKGLENQISLFDVGHYESESIILNNLKDLLKNQLPKLEIEVFGKDYSPIKYI